jgi:hypothetical protein
MIVGGARDSTMTLNRTDYLSETVPLIVSAAV